MVNPAAQQELLRLLSGNTAPDTSDLEARAKQGRLTFAATIKAMKGGCDCEPCRLLRQAVDILLADVETEVKPDAASVHPSA